MAAHSPVVIVGGGIAGLTTALHLQDRGVDVVVYEGTPRVGGRIHSVQDQGVIETGMQFYYSSYAEAFALLRRLGLEGDLHPIHVRGLLVHEGRIAPFDKSWPWLGLLTSAENLRLQAAVARQLIPLARLTPFDYTQTDPLDRIDAAAYFLERCGPAVVELAIRPMVTSYAFTEPEGHSLAMLLRILRLGALSKMYGLKQGNDSLPTEMAEQLHVVHAEVEQIVIDDHQVRGIVVDGQHVHADQVVCAVRGAQAGALLPGAPELANAFAALPYSNIVLVNLHLDHALSGPDWTYVLSRADGHRAAFGVDLLRRSPSMFPDHNSVLQVNFADPEAGELLHEGDDALVHIAAADMEAFLPGIAAHVRHASVVRRPLALPSFRIGMFDQVRRIQAMAQSIGGLHLAGDYLRAPLCEGAVRSGHDAARSVIAAHAPRPVAA